MTVEAFPLHWPQGWKTTPDPQHSRFKVTFTSARDTLVAELKRMNAKNPVISTNIPLRNDGLPYARFSPPRDTGVAVYFTYKGKQMVFACDKWKRIEDNLWSICKTIEAIRGIERWGASEMLERAFTGFAQLEAPSDEWWKVLGVDKLASYGDVINAFKALAKKNHPDVGGSSEEMARINKAYQEYNSLRTFR